MSSSEIYRSWVEINLAALSFNLRRLRSLHPKCDVIGVAKADAYGHGTFCVTRALAKEGVRIFAVANISEAEIVSRAAPRSDVLFLSPVLPEEVSAVVGHQRWIPTISNETELRAFEREGMRDPFS